MATLYKTATAFQRMLLRVVEGAVRDASNAHPDQKISPRMARSIAKRAAGTLSALWPGVLAAGKQSTRASDREPGAYTTMPRLAADREGGNRRRGTPEFTMATPGRGGADSTGPSPLSQVRMAHAQLSKKMRFIKGLGDKSLVDLSVLTLRVLATQIAREQARGRERSR